MCCNKERRLLMAKQITKVTRAMAKTLAKFDELDIDAQSADILMVPYLEQVHSFLNVVLEVGNSLTDVTGDEDEDEEDEDDTDDSDDEDEDDTDDSDDEDEDEDEEADDEDGEDDEDEDDSEDEDEEDEDDFDDTEEDEDEEEEEPAPKKKKVTAKAAPAKAVTKKPAAKAAAAPAKKSRKPNYAAMNFKALREVLVDAEPKRAKIIDAKMQGVGGTVKAKRLLELAESKGWVD